MPIEDRSPRKVATIPTTIRRRKLTPKTTSTSERIPTFPIQPLGAPSTIPARTHRTEVAKKVGPSYHAPPGSSRLATDFRSSGNPFSSHKPWIATRKAASARGFVGSLAASAGGKQVQRKATTGQVVPPIAHSIKKSSQAKPSQRMTPTIRLDRGTEARGPHEVVHRTTALSNRFHPTRSFADTPALGSPSSRGRHHSAGITPTRSPLRQVRRKTVPGSSSKHSHSSTNTTTINLFPPQHTPTMDDSSSSSSSSSNVICFEPDDRVTPNNLKRKLMTRPGGRPPRTVPGVGLKAARKTAAGTHLSSDDDDIIELASDDTSQSDWSTSSDDTDQLDPEEYAPSDPSPSTAPPKEVLEAFNKLTFHTRRMQETKFLPFLRRNFRRGFLLRCRKEGRHTGTDPKGNDEFSLEVIYRLDEGHLQYTVKGLGLFCPLCNLFGRFPTRDTLAAHLEWDHTEVLAHWMDMTMCWRVTIALTSNANIEEMEGLSLEDIPLEYTDYEMDEPNEALRPSVSDEAEASTVVAPLKEVASPPSTAPETSSAVQALDETQLSVPYVNVSSVPLLPPPTSPPAEPLIVLPPSPAPFALLRSSQPQLPPPSSPATNLSDPVAAHSDASASPHEIKPKTPLPATIDLPEIPSPTSTQPPQAACPPSSRPPNLPARCPTPPPKENPLGPAARYPYLPYVSEYGGPTMFYSSRPGGPRLYDLLGTLPMEPFGLMAWYILDIEEEMFDEDHIADELKVVLALWGRWIFLHRMEFLANYYQGVIMFVDEYWRMIHRAAGWDALRWYLVILKASKFLTFIDIAKVLKHYEYLVGMEYWEK